jgi:hypothetical protein
MARRARASSAPLKNTCEHDLHHLLWAEGIALRRAKNGALSRRGSVKGRSISAQAHNDTRLDKLKLIPQNRSGE